MFQRFLCFLLGFISFAAAQTTSAPSTPAPVAVGKFTTRSYQIDSPVLFTYGDLDGPPKEIVELGFSPGRPRECDVTKVLQKLGLAFPPGSCAIFSPDTSVLTLTSTDDDVNRAEPILEAYCVDDSLEATISVVDFRVAPGDILLDAKPAYLDLIKRNADSLVVQEHLVFFTKSGMRATLESVASNAPAVQPPADATDRLAPLGPSDVGMRGEVEFVLHSSRRTVDVNLGSRYRLTKHDEIGPEITGSESFTAEIDQPIVVNVTRVPEEVVASNKPATVKLRATIFKVRLVSLHGIRRSQ